MNNVYVAIRFFKWLQCHDKCSHEPEICNVFLLSKSSTLSFFSLWIDIDPALHTPYTVNRYSIRSWTYHEGPFILQQDVGRNETTTISARFFFCTAQNRQNLRKIVAMAGIVLHKFECRLCQVGWSSFIMLKLHIFFERNTLEALIRWHCFKTHTNLTLNYANFVQILALITLIKPKNKGTKTKPTTRFISSFRTAPNHNFFHLFSLRWDVQNHSVKSLRPSRMVGRPCIKDPHLVMQKGKERKSQRLMTSVFGIPSRRELQFSQVDLF